MFVGIEDGVDGMVHKTDLSWTLRINSPADLYKKGDDVEAIILSINHDEKKVSLGVKQIHDDPWASLLDDYRPGKVMEGVVVLSVAEYGVFVRVSDGIEALIPNGEIPNGVRLELGQVIKAEVSNVDSMDRRLTMSMRQVGESPAADQLKTLERESTAASRGGTLGDLLKEQLDQLNNLAPKKAKEEAAPAERLSVKEDNEEVSREP